MRAEPIHCFYISILSLLHLLSPQQTVSVSLLDMLCSARSTSGLKAAPFSVSNKRARTVVVRAEGAKINPDIKKDVDKVVDFVNTKDVEKKAVYCRCWRSGTFPLCNGAHVKHNTATGDNVGPLIISAE